MVFAIHELERPTSAEQLIEEHGDDLAVMLRGERQPLSKQEIANVQEKLKTLDAIYRFAAEQSSLSRGQFLEFIIVLILVLELVLILLGVMN